MMVAAKQSYRERMKAARAAERAKRSQSKLNGTAGSNFTSKCGA
jgi:hypothetical protein